MVREYEVRRPTTEAEAVWILEDAVAVLHEQIEFYRGIRKRAWNGSFVDNAKAEATGALAWLADRFPRGPAEMPLSFLQSRLKCPRCDCRRIVLVYDLPRNTSRQAVLGHR